jgi:hypothetical protein
VACSGEGLLQASAGGPKDGRLDKDFLRLLGLSIAVGLLLLFLGRKDAGHGLDLERGQNPQLTVGSRFV